MTKDVPQDPQAEQRERLEHFRQQVNARAAQPHEYVCEAVGAAVRESIIHGAFLDYLRREGWDLVYVGDGTPPAEAPQDWINNALELMDPGWVDPLYHVDELYRNAWKDGHRVGRQGSTPPAAPPATPDEGSSTTDTPRKRPTTRR